MDLNCKTQLLKIRLKPSISWFLITVLIYRITKLFLNAYYIYNQLNYKQDMLSFSYHCKVWGL